MTLWIAVPEDQRQQATRALIDADITVQGTWAGPGPGALEPQPRRDPGSTFLLTALGLILGGLGLWACWSGGWWIPLGVLSTLIGLLCITGALARPKPPTPDQVSAPA